MDGIPPVMSSWLGSGPRTVGRDRFDYVSAITSSQEQQLMLDLVRARDADPAARTPDRLTVDEVARGYGNPWALDPLPPDEGR